MANARTVLFLIPIALLAGLLAACQADKNAAVATDENVVFHYDDWRYMNRTMNDGRKAFITLSSTRQEGVENKSFIYLDTMPPGCGFLSFLVVTEMDQPFDSSLAKSDMLQGEMRVDDLAPRPVKFFYFFEKGTKYLKFRTENILDNKDVAGEVLKGQMIRFKFPTDKAVHSFRFTLRGAMDKARLAANNCKEEAAFSGSGPAQRQTPVQARPAPAQAPKAAPADDDSKYFQ